MTFKDERVWVDGVDGLPLHTYVWTASNVAEADVKAVVLLIHGQAERASRYARFAEALTNAGYAVVAADLRGHGKTVHQNQSRREWSIPGHMADEDGWNKAVADNGLLAQWIAKKFPAKPLYLFGHSLGSALAQNLMMTQPHHFSAMMLSGCWGGTGPERSVLRLILWLQYFVLGPRAEGCWVDALTFQRFLKPFEPIKTPADWLTRDHDEALKFVEDPLVGQSASCQHWIDFANGYEYINQPGSIQRIPAHLPISFWGGGQDPVSHFGRDFEVLKQNYARAQRPVDAFMFEQCRHELLNELERDDITKRMIAWFDNVN